MRNHPTRIEGWCSAVPWTKRESQGYLRTEHSCYIHYRPGPMTVVYFVALYFRPFEGRSLSLSVSLGLFLNFRSCKLIKFIITYTKKGTLISYRQEVFPPVSHNVANSLILDNKFEWMSNSDLLPIRSGDKYWWHLMQKYCNWKDMILKDNQHTLICWLW